MALSGGIRGTVTEAFRFHGYFSTASHEDYALFRPAASTVDSVTLATFDVVYDTLAIRTLGGEAEFDLGSDWSFAGGVKFLKYNTRSELRAWNLPRTTWNARATYALHRRVGASPLVLTSESASASAERQRYGDTHRLMTGPMSFFAWFLDLNFTANYTYNDRLGGWLTLPTWPMPNTPNGVVFPCKDFRSWQGCITPSDELFTIL